MAEGNASQPGGPKGPADDGKRFYSDGRCLANCSFKIGGGLGEDGARLDREQSLAD